MKRLFIFLCIFAMFTASCAMAGNEADTAYTYAPSDWAAGYVTQAQTKGIIPEGFTSDWRKPITREEFCLLAYALAEQVMPLTDEVPESRFLDTDKTEIAYLNHIGIINGRSDTEFAPKDSLTREEAAAILYRMTEKLDIKAGASYDTAYTDDGDISHWARDAVYAMLDLGIMNGTGLGFEPQGTYTVEQSIATLMRIADRASDTPIQEVSEARSFTDKVNALMPDNKNYMFSPYSIQTALALAANGAEGETKQQILDAADIGDLDEYNKRAQTLAENYSKAENLKLSSANSLWINTSRTNRRFSEEYKAAASKWYMAEVNAVDSSNAVDTINKWVSEKTNEKIPSIINDSSFDASIINAVYFKGAWQDEFSVSATKKDTFHNSDGTTCETDFMNDRGWYSYGSKDGVQVVALPYKSSFDSISEDGTYLGSESYDLDISMYIMLPDSDDTKVNISDMLDCEMGRTYLDLGMPKFKFDYSTDLNDILKSLGMKRAFNSSAQFGSMYTNAAGEDNMSISEVIHKTYIGVDEKGTEAAAVTAIMFAGAAMPPEPTPFKADRPFTFVIYDRTNQNILFAGRYAKAE